MTLIDTEAGRFHPLAAPKLKNFFIDSIDDLNFDFNADTDTTVLLLRELFWRILKFRVGFVCMCGV